MKRILLLSIIAWPLVLHAQDTINPYNISQPMTIELHNTDVYYRPYAPPAPTDNRDSLSCFETLFSDPNGVNRWNYTPITHDTVLQNWKPYGIPLGPYATWQRFFTAKRDSFGNPHNIIAGGGVGDRVTISANEDVDFRASGRVILKSGFHVKPGAFFHAYTEPKFDTLVFSDNFDSTAVDRSKWYISSGWGDIFGETGAECSTDSDARIDTDYQATDGHALDVMLVEDTCSCHQYDFETNSECEPVPDLDTSLQHFSFSTASIVSCPFPWQQADTPFTPYYSHGPFGKYEFRKKIPHIRFHTNIWGGNEFEWDMGETYNGDMTERHAGFVLNLQHGSFTGTFGKAFVGGDSLAVLRSAAANFSTVNFPTRIFINRFLYSVNCNFLPTDTFLTAAGTTPTFPLSFSDTTVQFTYERAIHDTTDPLPWYVTQATDGTWRIFHAAYRFVSGDSLRFSKAYQPTSVILNTGFRVSKTFNCHWEYNLNHPTDNGLIYLDDTMSPSDLHSGTTGFGYNVDEGGGIYPIPPVAFDGNDTIGGYEYHTYTMELLPHELRYLIDGNVVRRFPDRLVPPSSPYYDRMSYVPRHCSYLYSPEVDVDPTTQAYFDTHLGNPGVWDVTIGGNTYHAAHYRLDYIKIWDVPKDVYLPEYPK